MGESGWGDGGRDCAVLVVLVQSSMIQQSRSAPISTLGCNMVLKQDCPFILQNDLLREEDRRSVTLFVFLDLSVASDIVNHDILLGRLLSLAIGSSILSWFRSFLYDQTQMIQLGGCFLYFMRPLLSDSIGIDHLHSVFRMRSHTEMWGLLSPAY